MNNYYWILIAILKIVVTVTAVMIQRYIKFTGNWYPIITSVIAAMLFIIYGLTFENINELKKNNLPILILAGILLFIFLFICYNLIAKSSHPGYFKTLAIYELLFLLVISYYFFNAEITLRNWIGFVFIIIGTIFIINK
jgi:drug/metabolite transporter (DMT)-like permease